MFNDVFVKIKDIERHFLLKMFKVENNLICYFKNQNDCLVK